MPLPRKGRPGQAVNPGAALPAHHVLSQGAAPGAAPSPAPGAVSSPAPGEDQGEAFTRVLTESGLSLHALSSARPVLLVFLRHWGCSFCRETLHDLSSIQAEILARGFQLVFVHMGSPARGKPYFDHYHLSSIARISDPEQWLYRHPAFALPAKAIWRHLFDPAALRSVLGGIIARNGIGLIHREDADQMPGFFLLHHARVLNGYRYKSIAEKPDFLRMAERWLAR